MAKHNDSTQHKNTSKEWRLLAERDLSVAEHLSEKMYPTPHEIIAFHCQQAAEKYLKGALVIFGEDPPYIHDLDELCLSAERHNRSFSTIMPLCANITLSSTQPRYDLGFSLSDEEMRLALKQTKQIKAFLEKEVPDLFKDS